MRPAARALHSTPGRMRVARLGTLALCLVAACDVGPHVGEALDADVIAGRDAAPASDAAPPPWTQEPEVPGQLCYDGVDNDGDGAPDCADPGCAGIEPVCCVGESDEACCAEDGETLALVIPSSCGDGAVSSCELAPHLTFFGAPLPVLEDGGLVPQGDEGHGGVALGPPIDARSARFALEATIDAPATRCLDCVDAAGIGLLDALPAAGAPASVRLGVLVVGARDEVVVLLADEVVRRVPLVTGPQVYRVGVDAGRRAWVQLPGDTAPFEIDAVDMPAALAPAVFGRTQNRPAGVAAINVRGASIERVACEIPSAVVRRGEAVFPADDSAFSAFTLGRPSVVRVSDESTGLRVVAEVAGSIHLLASTGFGDLRGQDGLDPGPVVLAPIDDEVRLSDPWLSAEETPLSLYFVSTDELGDTAIHRADGALVGTVGFTRRETLLRASALPGVSALGAPTVWGAGEARTMIAAVRTDDGASRLVAFAPSGVDAIWSFRGGSLETAIVRAPASDDLFAFDRDSVGAPAVIAVTDVRGRSMWRLYYAGTRGTRASIGMLASGDGATWRPLGAILEGDETGFDALGATDPAPFLTEGQVELLYRGVGGSLPAFGRAGSAGMGDE